MVQGPSSQAGLIGYVDLARSCVRELLCGVCEIADLHTVLNDRREALVERLRTLLCADAAMWAWGTGSGETENPSVAATITCAPVEEHKAQFAMVGHQPNGREDYLRRIAERRRGLVVSVHRRQDLYSDAEWTTGTGFHDANRAVGFGTFVLGIRYGSPEVWSCLALTRGIGLPDFSQADANMVEMALEAIQWLHVVGNVAPIPASSSTLTTRQRTVMSLLLDGHTRKEIAKQMGISPQTVNDHAKAVYRHFGINSTTQLAAIFLKRK